MSTTAPEIVVVPYDPLWPERFAEEASLLRKIFSAPGEEIHHIGSTAVPGLSAKPLIDMLLLVDRLEPSAAYQPRVAELGYAAFSLTETDRLLFIKGSPRTHHLHIAELGSWHHWRLLLFRDCLRAQPAVAAQYEQLKRTSASRFANSRDEYTLSKTDFITSTVVALLHERPELLTQLRRRGDTLPPALREDLE